MPVSVESERSARSIADRFLDEMMNSVGYFIDAGKNA
jgi:hypothetical protein